MSRDRRPLANRHYRPPLTLRAPMMRTAKPRSRASSCGPGGHLIMSAQTHGPTGELGGNGIGPSARRHQPDRRRRSREKPRGLAKKSRHPRRAPAPCADVSSHGRIHVEWLPRMADFALWATACETALWPAGTVARAYAANRRAAIESIIEADPVAMCVRALMTDRTTWSGSASDILGLCAEHARADVSSGTSWTKNPRSLAGRLRRAQTF